MVNNFSFRKCYFLFGTQVGAFVWCFFFFFQAEDGIRDLYVTGVQTCALPICLRGSEWRAWGMAELMSDLAPHPADMEEGPRPVGRVPPHNLDAEASLLGAMLLSKIGRASCRERGAMGVVGGGLRRKRGGRAER